MKLLLLADIHGHLDYLIAVESVIAACDAIVIAGDMTDFGGALQARYVIEALSAFDKPLLAVQGNCDPPAVEEEMRTRGISLHGHRVACGDLQFIGVGGALPGAGLAPNHPGENEFRRVLEKGASEVHAGDRLVLVSHQPAWGVQLDRSGSGRHGGSRAIREFIEQYQPILAVSGHIHDAWGVDRLGETTLVNPGPFHRGRYAVAEIHDGRVNAVLYP